MSEHLVTVSFIHFWILGFDLGDRFLEFILNELPVSLQLVAEVLGPFLGHRSTIHCVFVDGGVQLGEGLIHRSDLLGEELALRLALGLGELLLQRPLCVLGRCDLVDGALQGYDLRSCLAQEFLESFLKLLSLSNIHADPWFSDHVFDGLEVLFDLHHRPLGLGKGVLGGRHLDGHALAYCIGSTELALGCGELLRHLGGAWSVVAVLG